MGRSPSSHRMDACQCGAGAISRGGSTLLYKVRFLPIPTPRTTDVGHKSASVMHSRADAPFPMAEGSISKLAPLSMTQFHLQQLMLLHPIFFLNSCPTSIHPNGEGGTPTTDIPISWTCVSNGSTVHRLAVLSPPSPIAASCLVGRLINIFGTLGSGKR
ncbi:hypothetical protein ACLOJK_000432 [Asimina triloba]